MYLLLAGLGYSIKYTGAECRRSQKSKQHNKQEGSEVGCLRLLVLIFYKNAKRQQRELYLFKDTYK